MKSNIRNIFLLSMAALISFSISGCWPVQMAMENMGSTFSKEPAKGKDKIKDPVKDSIKLGALWSGHSTSLLQIYDKVIILDPVFENVISEILKRNTEAGLEVNSVAKMDAILISHAHMDHLSFYSLEKLAELFPGTPLIFPKGDEKYIPSFDLDFMRINTGNSRKSGFIGETKLINGIEITAVFADHFGGRYGVDSYLWNVPGCTGYVIHYKDKTVFYAGDTAYDSLAFKEIGRKFKIDLAFIPVGPCDDCGKNDNFLHIAAGGAFKVFNDLNADKMIPVHYGSFAYFNDPNYPVEELKKIIAKEDNNSLSSASGSEQSRYYSDRIIILKEGEQYVER